MSVLDGSLVRLRLPEPDDAAALLAHLSHPSLVGRRGLPDEFPAVLPLSRRDVAGIIDRWQADRENPGYVVTRQASDDVVGHAVMGWGWDPICPYAEVVINPELWGRGFGSDALLVMHRYLFEWTPALFVGTWLPDWNAEGLRFVVRHGYRPSGRIRRVGMRGGAPFDAITHNLTRGDWRSRSEEERRGT